MRSCERIGTGADAEPSIRSVVEELPHSVLETKDLVAAYLGRISLSPCDGRSFPQVVPELASRFLCTPLVITPLGEDMCNLTFYDSPECPVLFGNVENSTAKRLEKQVGDYWDSYFTLPAPPDLGPQQ